MKSNGAGARPMSDGSSRAPVVVRIWAFLILLVPSTHAIAEPPAPTTSWGHPNLQGVWDYRTITPLEKPEELGERTHFSTEEAKEFTRSHPEREEERFRAIRTVGGEPWADNGKALSEGNRAGLIYDPPSGRLPPKTDLGERNSKKFLQQLVAMPDDPEGRALQERCVIYPKIPLTSDQYNNNIQIIQTPTHVVLLLEMIHDARIVPLNDRPRLPVRTWMGQSRGRFEGETLVVETTGFRDYLTSQGFSRDRKITERFTRVDDTTLDYDYTIDDPGAYTDAWSARQTLVSRSERIYEYACHEGNYSLAGILQGARAADTSD